MKLTKKLFLVVLLMASVAGAKAQVTVTVDNNPPFSSDADTTFMLEGHKVKVEKKQNLQDKIKEKKKKSLTGLHFGWAFALGTPEGMDITNKGWPREIGFDLPIHDFSLSESFLFHINLGVNWKNFRMKNGNSFMKNYDDGGKIFIGKPSTLGTKGHVQMSRAKIFSLQLPLLFEYRPNKNFFLAAGPVVNFNLHGSILTRYTNHNGEEVRFESNGLRQSPVTVDLKGMVGFHKSAAVYVRWSPMRQLREKYAPNVDFTALSVGLQLVP